MRFQQPRIETHGQLKRLRAYVTERQPDGTFRRVRKVIPIGSIHDKPGDIKRRAAEVIAQLNSGSLIVERQLRMSELIAGYREAGLPTVASNTQVKYKAHLAKIDAAFGSLELGEVRPKLVQEWLLSLRGTYSQATLQDIKNLAGAVYSWGRDAEIWSGTNPFSRTKIRSDVPPREKRLLSAADVMALCAELERDETVVQGSIRGTDVRLMVLIAAVTGCRISEILRIQAEDADESGRLRVRGEKSEAAKRHVWLGGLTTEIQQRGPGLIFCRPSGKPVDTRDIQQHILRPAAERCGLYWLGFGFHSLRRLSITLHQQGGATPIEAMRAAGHSKPTMTMLYTLQDSTRERDRADQISKRLAG